MKHCGKCGTELTDHLEGGASRLICPACGWKWYNPPTPVTLVLVTTDDGRVVYTRKNSFEPWRWTVVAGFIERGETAEAAALREVKEETGLDAEIVRFTGTHVYERNPDQLVVTFHVRVTGGTPMAGDDVDQIDIAPADPSRLREGATSWWLVKQYYDAQMSLQQAQQQQ
jgi:NAD+ diphosphatase